MKGKIISLSKDLSGQWILTLNASSEITAVYDELKDKDLRIDIKQWRERRSKDANAYFHVLVTKIAKKMNLPLEEVKHNIVLDYGTVATDEQGAKYGIMIPSSLDVKKVYKYARLFDTRLVGDKEFNCYTIYLETHLLDTHQMFELLEGVIQEAQALGIETITPAEKQRLLDLWEERNAR